MIMKKYLILLISIFSIASANINFKKLPKTKEKNTFKEKCIYITLKETKLSKELKFLNNHGKLKIDNESTIPDF